MIILTIRTDNPEAELGIFVDGDKAAYYKWAAHYQLAETIHSKMKDLLKSINKDWADIGGLIVYRGPGSFTGLRIGLSVANALADGLNVPVVGTGSDNWIEEGQLELQKGINQKIVFPEYGAPVHITSPKH